MQNAFESASMKLKNGMTLLFKDQKAREALEKKYGPDNPPPAEKNFWYGTCSTSSGTAAKIVTTTSGDFSLAAGNMIRVLMADTNIQTQPTLSVDGSTAKRIKNLTSQNNITTNLWRAGEVIDLVYDGTEFVVTRGGLASTTYYGVTKLSNSVSSSSQVLAATSYAVKQAYDLASVAFSLDAGIEIPASSDLDDYLTAGSFYVKSSTEAATISNSPTTVSGYKLEVLYPTGLSGYAVQIAICNNYYGDIFLRRYASPTWGSWSRVLHSGRVVSVAEGGTSGTTGTEALLNLGAFDLRLGTAIQASSNLNDYTTPGSYYVASAAVAATITNSPVTGMGYKLVVFSLNANSYIMQVAFTYNGQIIKRIVNSNGWGGWYKISETAL